MIEYDDEALFLQDGIGKQLKITYGDGGEITNSELASESFALVEKLTSSGGFVIGECNSSYVEFNVGYGTEPLEGEDLTVTITPDGGDDFQIGKYVVVSDKPTADRRWRKITAYDALYAVINMDVTSWYDTILPDAETSVTIKDFRDSFFLAVGITQEETTLPNDSLTITRVSNFTQLSGKTVLNAICEINGCCGRINRDGNFVYQFIHSPSEPFFPSQILFPSDYLFPKYDGSPKEIGLNGKYMSAKYEDYIITMVGALQIRNNKNDVGVTVGSGLVYVVEGNFLAYGLTTQTLTAVANNILAKIGGVYFCPAEIQAQGNPCLELGDGIVLHTRYATIESIIFQRKLKGIQSLIDSYTSKGAKDTKKNINSVDSKFAQTEGSINKVEADLVVAQKIIADEIEAESARITTIEANYVNTQQLSAVDAKINNLTAVAITTQNLSAQTISGNQINAGNISVNYLDVNGIVNSLSARSITVSGLSVNGSCTLGGRLTYWVYDDNIDQWVLCGSTE